MRLATLLSPVGLFVYIPYFTKRDLLFQVELMHLDRF